MRILSIVLLGFAGLIAILLGLGLMIVGALDHAWALCVIGAGLFFLGVLKFWYLGESV